MAHNTEIRVQSRSEAPGARKQRWRKRRRVGVGRDRGGRGQAPGAPQRAKADRHLCPGRKGDDVGSQQNPGKEVYRKLSLARTRSCTHTLTCIPSHTCALAHSETHSQSHALISLVHPHGLTLTPANGQEEKPTTAAPGAKEIR